MLRKLCLPDLFSAVSLREVVSFHFQFKTNPSLSLLDPAFKFI